MPEYFTFIKNHNFKSNYVIFLIDIYDLGYHNICYKAFTALKKKFYNTGLTKTKEAALSLSKSSVLKRNHYLLNNDQLRPAAV